MHRRPRGVCARGWAAIVVAAVPSVYRGFVGVIPGPAGPDTRTRNRAEARQGLASSPQHSVRSRDAQTPAPGTREPNRHGHRNVRLPRRLTGQRGPTRPGGSPSQESRWGAPAGAGRRGVVAEAPPRGPEDHVPAGLTLPRAAPAVPRDGPGRSRGHRPRAAGAEGSAALLDRRSRLGPRVAASTPAGPWYPPLTPRPDPAPPTATPARRVSKIRPPAGPRLQPSDSPRGIERSPSPRPSDPREASQPRLRALIRRRK